MTDLSSAAVSISGRIALDQVKPVVTRPGQAISIAESDEATFQNHLQSMETMLEGMYSRPPDLSRNPAYQDYAQVMVGGKVVATIDNNGGVTTSNAVGAKLGAKLPGSVNGQTGPVLAEARAGVIADLLGGKVVKASTALDQSSWATIPTPTPVVDRAALTQDPVYASLQQFRQARAAFLAQQLAQDSS